MREYDLSLFSLRLATLFALDLVGFTLQYELSYTTILNMLQQVVFLFWPDRSDLDPS